MFFLHDTWVYKGGRRGLKSKPAQTVLALLTIAAGAFVCVAGTYVSVRGIVDAYAGGEVPGAFTCSVG